MQHLLWTLGKARSPRNRIQMEHLRPSEGATLNRETASPEAIQQWLVAQIAASCDVADEEIDVRDPLTSFGLESLTLFTLAGDLASWLDRDIPATVLWEYPTIEEVAGHLGQDSQHPSDTSEAPGSHALVTIQPQGEVPPLFLVHDVSGALWCYMALMRHMGNEQPVYGFQIPAHEQETFEVASIEELAALYVSELRRKHPQGPYRLGGFSMGGVIAFEMAQQLRAARKDIALLALMDTNYPSLKHLDPLPHHKFRVHLRNFWPLSLREKMLYLLERNVPSLVRSFYFHARHLQPLGWGKKLRYVRNLIRRQRAVELPGSAVEQQRFRELLLHSDVQTQLQNAALAYTPLPYDGVLTLLRARWQWTRDDDSRKWRDVALRGTRQLFSSGSHGVLIAEPHVREFAANLKQCLRDE